MIYFETRVSVPKHIVEKIGLEIRERFMRGIYEETHLSSRDIGQIDEILQSVILKYSSNQEKSCDGYSLTKDDAEIIANEMKQNRKLMAVKEFRRATGAGLREAKSFLEKFGVQGIGETAAIEFLSVFI